MGTLPAENDGTDGDNVGNHGENGAGVGFGCSALSIKAPIYMIVPRNVSIACVGLAKGVGWESRRDIAGQDRLGDDAW